MAQLREQAQSAIFDYFSTQEMRDSEKIGKLVDANPADLIPFRNHTFKVKDDEDMEKLKESIKESGILEPALGFWNEDGNLELISGHRRQHVALMLGLETMPVLIKPVNRDEATIIMGESNLQRREKILPSEKAFTYKGMLEAMNRLPGRPKNGGTEFHDFEKGKSRDILADNFGISGRQIQNYIRLTNLIQTLLDLVDEGRVALKPAVELSYIPANLQQSVFEYYEANMVTPSHAQAIQFHKLFDKDLLTEDRIYAILSEEKGNQRAVDNKLVFKNPIIKEMLTKCKDSREREERVIKALKLLEEQEKIMSTTQHEDYEL